VGWYELFGPATQKWVTLAVFAGCFGLILYRKVKIVYVSLAAAALLVALGILSPVAAAGRVDWDVLAIYWGYGMLALVFRESGLPAFIALHVLARVRREKYALLFLCGLAALLSSFMANPVVVIMLAPLAIEMAERLKASLFLYLVGLAISSNVVTTVSMVADPPALILAMSTGMVFLDFYWFQGKPGLGTLSVVGVVVALLTLLVQFRGLDKHVSIALERVEVGYGPLVLFGLSVAALAVLPMRRPGIVGVLLGVGSLVLARAMAGALLREFDWETLWFLVGIFVLVGAVEHVGLLEDFVAWLGATGLRSPAVALLIITWLSVALSSFIDNVPYTVLMIPVCELLATSLGVSPWPLYFGMLVGTGIGGNITPVGATANVLACGMLEKRGYRIDLGSYLMISVPFSVAAVLVVHVLIQLIWL
jgi:Na+/H+ antiporter NhaD/arsenite permease-like protein